MFILKIPPTQKIGRHGASMAQVLAIWRGAVPENRKYDMAAGTLLCFALAFLFYAFDLKFAPGLDDKLFVPALPLTIMALFFWDRFLIHALHQNSPSVARLVPRHLASIRLAVALAWVAVLAPCAALARGFEDGCLFFLIYAIYTSALAQVRAGYTAGSAAYMGMFLAAFLAVRSETLREVLGQPPVAVVLSVAAAVFAWWSLRLSFPRGGERHWKIRPGQHQPIGPLTLLAWRPSRPSSFLFGWKLRQDVKRGVIGQLLLHALGPQHRIDPLLRIVGAVLLATAMWSGFGIVAGPFDLLTLTIAGFGAGLLIGGQVHGHMRVVKSVESTKVEQALVRLTARAPQASAIGPVLARELLSISLVEWAAVAVSGLAIASLLGSAHLNWPATILVCTFAFNGWALRDYAGKEVDSYGRAMLQAFAVIAGGVAMLLTLDQPMWWAMSAVVTLVVGAFIIRERYRMMLAALSPFPSGRFGL